jgi:hypothetical protein
MSVQGSALILHAAFSGWVFADGSTLVDDDDVVLDNVDVRIAISTNSNTGEFFVSDVQTATDYHAEDVSVLAKSATSSPMWMYRRLFTTPSNRSSKPR